MTHKDNVDLHPERMTQMLDLKEHVDPEWKVHAAPWIYVVPWGLRAVLNWVKNQYSNPLVYITENGIADDGSSLNDTVRIEFYRDHCNNVLKAIANDGCRVEGYFAWSLLDNFEWILGYSMHFGLYSVDFSDPNRARVPKASVGFYRDMIRNNGFREKQT